MRNIDDVPMVVHEPMELPSSYDLRRQVAPPVVQGKCGSCWAITATMCAQDRMRMKGMYVPKLSYQAVADCAEACISYGGRPGCSEDCAGGFMATAYEFLKNKGTVSARDYGAKHVHGNHLVDGEVRTECTMDNTDKRYKIKDYYMVHTKRELYGITNAHDNPPHMSAQELQDNARNIMTEIFKHGPVSVCFNLYSDMQTFAAKHPFSSDKVYEIGWENNEPAGPAVGDVRWQRSQHWPYFEMGHSVSLCGWGTNSEGIDYWIARNSWGLNGDWIKIRRGVNCSAIEADVEAPLIEAVMKPSATIGVAGMSGGISTVSGKIPTWGIVLIVVAALAVLALAVYLALS